MHLDKASLISSIERSFNPTFEFGYVNPHNPTRITVADVDLATGSIFFKRRRKGQHLKNCVMEKISATTINRVVEQVSPHEAFTIEAVLKGSGNARSVLEAILAQLPEFYVCYPARILNGSGHENVKHLYWNPDKPHPFGSVTEAREIKGVMKKVPMSGIHIAIPEHQASNFAKLRVHQQIQVKIFEIGAAMRWAVWIAENDRNMKVGRKPLASHPSAIKFLPQVDILKAFPLAQKSARHLDVALFRADGFIPAVIEIEQSTGVLSGLNRMESFRQTMSGVFANHGAGGTSFTICAEDSKRDEVFKKVKAAPQYHPMAPRFLSYSNVDLMWSLCVNGRSAALKDNLFEVFSEACPA
ncbi:hypothetical protein G6L37_00870 [Agrobacterium rubi]|nr:hypothetical protein [Agrobacterium rubi]NTF23943.1 hypothetical protein [Agrobacterium rubi]